MGIIQPNHALSGDESGEIPSQLPATTIHTLLTLAKLVQTIQSKLHEEKQDDPQTLSYPQTEATAAVSMAPTHPPAAEAVQPGAGTLAEAVSGGQSAAATEGGES